MSGVHAAAARISKDLAQRIARGAPVRGADDWDALRDHVDGATGEELDCFQLDMLTDWTQEAMARAA